MLCTLQLPEERQSETLNGPMLAQIRVIDRKQEVPHDGAMCDLLWCALCQARQGTVACCACLTLHLSPVLL